MGPDWIQSLWTRHHCTLDDPSYNQFRETLNLLRNEHDLEKGRNLALCAAKLILLAKKVNPIYSHSISSVQYKIVSHLLPIHDITANFCAILIRPQVLLDRRMTIYVWETIRCQHNRLRTRSRCMWRWVWFFLTISHCAQFTHTYSASKTWNRKLWWKFHLIR